MIDHFCSLKIDHQLELGRLLNRKISRFSTAEYLGDQPCLLTVDLRQGPVGRVCPRFCNRPIGALQNRSRLRVNTAGSARCRRSRHVRCPPDRYQISATGRNVVQCDKRPSPPSHRRGNWSSSSRRSSRPPRSLRRLPRRIPTRSRRARTKIAQHTTLATGSYRTYVAQCPS